MAWLILLSMAAGVHAWHAPGHRRATTGAAALCKGKLPAFFVEGAKELADHAVNPDAMRNQATPQLRDVEGPDHYFDIELLKGKPMPATRYEFVELCKSLDLDVRKVGTLPYALVEGTQRLTLAFAQHRKRPDDPTIRARCLIYAGTLAHYAQDVCQPLHVTVDHDGRTNPDGTSPATGIHQKVDALLGQARIDEAAAGTAVSPHPYEQLLPGALREIELTRRHIDEVYALEKELSDANPQDNDKLNAFATERYGNAMRVTASFWLTAWRDSEKIELPQWWERER